MSRRSVVVAWQSVMLELRHMPKSPDPSSTFRVRLSLFFFPKGLCAHCLPIHVCVPLPVSFFFFIFFVFFSFLTLFSRYPLTLCRVAPAFGPLCPRPNRVRSIFFSVVPLCLHSFSFSTPSLTPRDPVSLHSTRCTLRRLPSCRVPSPTARQVNPLSAWPLPSASATHSHSM